MSVKEIIVLGDVELGAGTLTDDFISDRTLSKLILSLAAKKIPIDLVFNGDTFDFLKAGTGNRDVLITERISLAKMRQIHWAHPRVFEALKTFATKKDKNIYFVLGNHDQDIAFKGVQQYIRSILGKGNIHFPGFTYQQHGVYVEHGHQHDLLNRMPLIIEERNGQKILHNSFATSSVLSSFIDIKEEHPFLERIHSHDKLFRMHPIILQKLMRKGMRHLAKFAYSLIFDPTHPITNRPEGLARELVRRIRFRDWNVPDVSHAFAQNKQLPKLCILGHKHIKRIHRAGHTIILPDTWRDEYRIDMRRKMLIPKTKQYVRVVIKNNKLHSWDIVPVRIRRSVWRFKDVVRDELGFLKRAAQEEGYEPLWSKDHSHRSTHTV